MMQFRIANFLLYKIPLMMPRIYTTIEIDCRLGCVAHIVSSSDTRILRKAVVLFEPEKSLKVTKVTDQSILGTLANHVSRAET